MVDYAQGVADGIEPEALKTFANVLRKARAKQHEMMVHLHRDRPFWHVYNGTEKGFFLSHSCRKLKFIVQNYIKLR